MKSTENEEIVKLELRVIPLFSEPKITSQANVRNTPSISKKVYFYRALCKADVTIVA